MYPPVPELPGTLVGLALSEQPSGKSVLLVGLDREGLGGLDALMDELCKTMLHDILSGGALGATQAQHQGACLAIEA